MARKSARKRTARKAQVRQPNRSGPPRERIVAALMTLLAEKPIERIELAAVAAQAGVTLAQLRAEFTSTLAILAAHIAAIDGAVLEGIAPDMAEESPRDRLFEVLMRRLELMSPHKAALRSLMRSAACDPPFGLALNGIAVRSQQWMLSAADIGNAGPKGLMRAQGLAVLFACVLRTFVDDDEPDMARTMAELDRELTRGERWSGMLDDLCALPRRFARATGRRRRGRRGEAMAA
jgi:AcrR family transcriptional regulator